MDIIYYLYKFFTLVLTCSFSLKTEWQQVTLSFQDSSKYSSRSQLYCGLFSCSDLQFSPTLFQAFRGRSESTNYNWYHRYFTAFSCSLARSKYLSIYSFSLISTFWNGKIYLISSSFLLLINTRYGLQIGIWGSVSTSKSKIELWAKKKFLKKSTKKCEFERIRNTIHSHFSIK